jgi:RNA polymerase sigma factor (sigma-70 family)
MLILKHYPPLSHAETIDLGISIQNMFLLFDGLKIEGKNHDRIKICQNMKLPPKQKQILEEGIKAREKMILHNMKLVVSWAGRFKSVKLDIDDLTSYGTIALIKAVEKFDPSRGYKFSTYAYLWVRSEISKQRGLADSDLSITADQNRRIYRISKLAQKFRFENNKSPTITELANCGKLSEKSIRNTLNNNYTTSSIDDKYSDFDEGLNRYLYYIDPIINLVEEETKIEDLALIHSLMDKLPHKNREYIYQYYFENKPIKTIAKENNINKLEVSKTISESIKLMKNYAKAIQFGEPNS